MIRRRRVLLRTRRTERRRAPPGPGLGPGPLFGPGPGLGPGFGPGPRLGDIIDLHFYLDTSYSKKLFESLLARISTRRGATAVPKASKYPKNNMILPS